MWLYVWLHALCCKDGHFHSIFFFLILTDTSPYMHAYVHMQLTVHFTVCLQQAST